MTSLLSLAVCLLLGVLPITPEGRDPAPLEAPGSAAPPAASAPTPAPQPDSSLKEEFDRAAAKIAEDRKAAETKLAEEYTRKIDALVQKLTDEGRPVIAAAARAEKARVEAGAEITEESASRAPYEILLGRAGYLEKRRAIAAEYDAKMADRTERYIGALAKAAATASPEQALAARTKLHQERERLREAGQIAPRITKRTRAAGGGGGGRFEEIGGEDALLTGLIVHTGNFAGHHVLVAVQPIFRTTDAKHIGTRRGRPLGKPITLEARDGYAIGALNFRAGDRVDGLEVVYMKIQPERRTLDPTDSYKSQWIGGKGGGSVQIPASGNAIVGIFGANGLELDSLGLIELLPPPAPAPKVRVTSGKEVTRENPATVEVAKIAAEPLVEAPGKDAGKWQRVPEVLRGAKIFSATDQKHLGVAEYKVTAPGRVYLACNYENQGNSSGGWTKERWLPEDFVENGWARVEGLEIVSWGGRTFILFTREVKAGETGRLRCNKYEPPYFITFIP